MNFLHCLSPDSKSANQREVKLSLHMHMLSRLSRVRLCAVPRTVARQAPPSMGFSRQEYWSGLPCPPPEDLTDPGIEPMSPLFQGHSLPLQCVGSPDLSQAQSNLCSSRKCSSLVPPAASNSTGRHQGIAGITGHHLSTRASQASQGITSPPGHPRHHRASPLHTGMQLSTVRLSCTSARPVSLGRRKHPYMVKPRFSLH